MYILSYVSLLDAIILLVLGQYSKLLTIIMDLLSRRWHGLTEC